MRVTGGLRSGSNPWSSVQARLDEHWSRLLQKEKGTSGNFLNALCDGDGGNPNHGALSRRAIVRTAFNVGDDDRAIATALPLAEI